MQVYPPYPLKNLPPHHHPPLKNQSSPPPPPLKNLPPPHHHPPLKNLSHQKTKRTSATTLSLLQALRQLEVVSRLYFCLGWRKLPHTSKADHGGAYTLTTRLRLP